MEYNGRRSPIYATKGCVASSQPLATEIGLSILKKGGNAADAAVAVAAALNVTQPASTGIGGDCFCLFYDAKTERVKGINGSGRCPQNLTLDYLENHHGISYKNGDEHLPPFNVNTITVPGAAAAWEDTLKHFGTMSLAEVLAPAIDLAENGFPVSDVSAFLWERGESCLKSGPYGNEMLLNGRAPKAGEIMKLPNLANTFRELSKDGFYHGRIAKAIVDLIQSHGGVMNLDDLSAHRSTMDEPISINYRGIDVWEMPPNGQGITALMALNILEGFELSKMKHNSAEYLHLLIESLRLAFADTRYYVADPSVVHVPIKDMLSKEYAATRRSQISFDRATVDIQKGSPTTMSNTVYFCVVDQTGNACSFINSNYMGFGTGLIPNGCGFTLQNRGANFSLIPDHPNVLAPGKRPYHTIIPGMATKNGKLWAPFGVMGGFMQPQGHVQVLVNMIDHGMDPQAALDASRFLLLEGTSSSPILLEEGISQDTIDKLNRMGHRVNPQPIKGFDRQHFGNGQIIRKDHASGVLCAGSDSRIDGMALGWC